MTADTIKCNPMQRALGEARAAADRGEVPVGAVLLAPGGDRAWLSGNRTRELTDPTAHAELLVIRAACRDLGMERLPGFDLYVTLEPCTMCAAAISFARIRRLYYGASDEKTGGVEQGALFFSRTTCHHAPEIYNGIAENQSRELLHEFFRSRRGS